MTLPTMLAHERAAKIVMVAHACLVGPRRPSSRESSSWRGSLAGLDNLVAWLPGAFPFKRASMVLQSSSMAGSASSLSTTGRSD